MIERVARDHGATLDFPLLSDPGHRVIDRWGLFNENSAPNRPVPHPATLVVDREGIVRWKFVEIDYKVRPTNEQVLAAVRAVREGRTPEPAPSSEPEAAPAAAPGPAPSAPPEP